MPGEDVLSELEAQLTHAMHHDQQWARARVQRLRQRLAAGQPVDRLEATLRARLAASVKHMTQRAEAQLAITYPEDLPVSGHREEVLALLRAQSVLVLTGETGSGKTTQLPKMLLEAGYGLRGTIACTQPRRIAARSVAARIREELAAPEGVIASAMRFEDRSTDLTRVKVMTDGLLLAEAARDHDLSRYDAVLVDEAHERSLNIDVLLGLLRRVRQRRPDLRIVVTSATIDAERFADYFAVDGKPAPVVSVSGRTYPVEVRYEPPVDEDLGYLDAAIEAIDAVHSDEPAGDVLCFLPTERDILEGERRLRDRNGLTVLPLFGRLNPHEQARVFAKVRGRKVVLSTNIAETSLTVPGIRYVIDSGLARMKRYAPASRTERLPVEAVSQASLAQRAGRAGRVAPGVCIRLFAEPDFTGRAEFTDPEIKRSNLAGVLLRHLSMGLGDPEQFPWLDPPASAMWHQARKLLTELGALAEGKASREKLSALGRRIARLPVDPQIGRILLAGIDDGVAHEVTALAAFLSIQDPRLRPRGEEAAADAAQAVFIHEAGDLMTALNMWDAYHAHTSNSARSRFCKKHHLGQRRMREWADLRHQLWQHLRDDAPVELPANPHPSDQRPIDMIHRSVLVGMLGNVCMNDKRKRCFQAGGNREVHLHPGSALRRTRDGGKRKGVPEWLLACEMVETSRTFVRLCAPIEPAWVEILAGDRVKKSYRDPQWQGKGQRVICRERVTWHGLPLVTARQVSYAAIDPVDATRVFIRSALVEDGLRRTPAVVVANRELLSRAARVAARLRDPAVTVDDESLVGAYGKIMLRNAKEEPIASADDLVAWCRRHGEQTLRLDPADIIDPIAWTRAEEGFPEQVLIGGRAFPLVYRYAPGEDDDGITLEVAETDLLELRQVPIDRLIPGMIPLQVEGLLRALPKEIRRRCIPLQATADMLTPKVLQVPTTVHHAVATALAEHLGEGVPSPDPAALAPELRLRLVVRDDTGRIRYHGRDIEDALAGVGGSDPLAPLRSLWATRPGCEWPGELPKRVSAHGVEGWIGLLRDRARDAGVAVRRAVFSSRQAMLAWHHDGLAAMIEATCDNLLDTLGPPPSAVNDDNVGMSAVVAKRQLALAAAWADPFAEVRTEDQWRELAHQACTTVVRIEPEIDQLLTQVATSVNNIRKRLKRGMRGMASAAVATDTRADLERLLGHAWPHRLLWPATRRLPHYLQALEQRLDDAERAPDRARQCLDRRRGWLQRWQDAIGDISPRLLLALGLHDDIRQAASWMEELLAVEVGGGKPALGASGVHLQNALRQFDHTVTEHEQTWRTIRADLLDARPTLERLAHDNHGRGLLMRLDVAMRDWPDLGVGADVPGQVAAVRDLLQRIRHYCTGG